MKKLVAFFCIISLPYLCYGQNFRYGLSLGVNSSGTHGMISRAISTNRTIGINAGIKLQYEVAKNVNIHTLIAYSQKGSSRESTFNSNSQTSPFIPVSNYLNLDYIDFPLLISPVITLNCVKLYPILGIDQGFLVSANNKAPRVDINSNTSIEYINLLKEDSENYPFEQDKINRYNLGVIGGVGIQFGMFSKRTAFIETRYAHGMNNVSNPSNHIYVKNNCLSFNTGLLF